MNLFVKRVSRICHSISSTWEIRSSAFTIREFSVLNGSLQDNVTKKSCSYNCTLLTNSDIYNLNFPNRKSVYKSQGRHSSDFAGGPFYKWLSESTAVEYTQNFIVSVHDFTDLPWWGTIICTTVFLRSLITLPLAIYQTSILAKVENIALVEMPEITKEVRKEVASLALQNKWDDRRTVFAYKRKMKEKWDSLVIRDNCHPFKGTITLWFQLPMWICFTASLRNVAYMLPHHDATAQLLYLQMSVGGFLWIPNLTLPDTTWFLPALLGISNLAIIELQTLRRVRQAPLLQKYVTNFFRCLSLALIPISATVPSAVCLYWTTSSILGLGQNLLLMSNRIRNVFHIPDTPTTLDNPYLQLTADIKERGRNIKKLVLREK